MIFVEIAVLLLLVMNIFYCLKLNKKIVNLHENKKELAVLFEYFDREVMRAEKAIESLRNISDKGTRVIESRINEAKIVIDELAVIIDHAAQNVKQLENVNAKVILKEQMVRQDNGLLQQNANKIYRDIPTNNLSKADARHHSELTDTKKIAIDDLLDKISQIQKKNNNG